MFDCSSALYAHGSAAEQRLSGLSEHLAAKRGEAEPALPRLRRHSWLDFSIAALRRETTAVNIHARGKMKRHWRRELVAGYQGCLSRFYPVLLLGRGGFTA